MSAHRTIEQFSQLLLGLHDASRSAPPERFPPAALALLPGVLPITSAWWGLTSGWRIHGSALLNLPAEHLKTWEERKGDDVIARQALANPRSTTVFDGLSANAHQSLSSWMSEYGLTQAMCVTTPSRGDGLTMFLSVYRSSTAFSPGEQKLLSLLVEHFALALEVSWSRHIERPEGAGRILLGSNGLLGKDGVLHRFDARLVELVRMEFPAWEPPAIPSMWMDKLLKIGNFRGRRIHMKATPFNEMLSLRVSKLGDLDKLTPREAAVARAFADGLSHKEIANSLRLSPATVRNYISSIYSKLEVSSKARLSQKVTMDSIRSSNLD